MTLRAFLLISFTLVIFAGCSSGESGAEPTFDAIITALALGDIDGDGDLDLVAGTQRGFDVVNNLPVSRDAGCLVLLNDGSGNFRDSGQRLGVLRVGAVALGDIDDDGDLDLVVGQYDFYHPDVGLLDEPAPDAVWLNDGTGMFTDTGQRLANELTRSLLLADLDGDTDLDLVIGAALDGRPQDPRGVAWFFNDGSGTFVSGGKNIGEVPVSGLALGDLDSDGAVDVAVSTGNLNARLLFNGGSGLFEVPATLVPANEGSVDIAIGDLDGAGGLDLVTVHQNGIRVWTNDGNRNFTQVAHLATSRGTWQKAKLADADGDGDLDLFAISLSVVDLPVIWTNDGFAGFTASDGPNQSSASDLAVGDLDGDGDTDHVVAAGDRIAVFLNE